MLCFAVMFTEALRDRREWCSASKADAKAVALLARASSISPFLSAVSGSSRRRMGKPGPAANVTAHGALQQRLASAATLRFCSLLQLLESGLNPGVV